MEFSPQGLSFLTARRLPRQDGMTDRILYLNVGLRAVKRKLFSVLSVSLWWIFLNSNRKELT